jgi:hypothetical protein
MAQEFTINSSAIESKINQLLPSQGGFGAGVDFSASTMVIPIVDLTETAEGSNVRADLQTALSFSDVTAFEVTNATTTVINTTGYYRIFGIASCSATSGANITLFDGTSNKLIYQILIASVESFDFVVFVNAGESVKIGAGASNFITGCTKQIADISGNLTNPT